jgi:serine protease Do
MSAKAVVIVSALLCAFLLLAARPAPAPPASPTPPAQPTPPPSPHDRVFFFHSGGSWLGVSIADVSAERAKEVGLKEERGAEVKAVLPGSPAEEAGLKAGDVILEYQGTRVEGVAQLTRLVRETPAGRTVGLEVFRDGSARRVQVKMTEREIGHGPHKRLKIGRFEGPDAEWHDMPEIDLPAIEIPDIEIPDLPLIGALPPSLRLGAVVESVGKQLGEYFGVKDGEGVLVRSVRKGSPGDQAGLRAGDVIIKVDDERVGDSSDLRQALRDRRDKDLVLTVVRDRREQTLKLPAPKRERRPYESLLAPEDEEGDEEDVAPEADKDVERRYRDLRNKLHEEARRELPGGQVL